jgi:O-antigen ligase
MMEQSSNEAIPTSSISQQVSELLRCTHLPFESLLLAWFMLSPVAAFYLRFPFDKSVITFDRAVVLSLVIMLWLKFWQSQTIQNPKSKIQSPQDGLRTSDTRGQTFFITKFELAWLSLAAIALLNALLQSTNVTYAIKIAIDTFFLPLVVFHVARHHFNWQEHKNVIAVAAMALALLLFATGGYEFLTGTNLLAYKGSSVLREGELRVNGPFAADSSYAIIGLLITLFLRLLPHLLQIRFDKSARLMYLGALSSSAVAALLPLFRSVGLVLVLCWLAIEYLIHARPKVDAAIQTVAEKSGNRRRKFPLAGSRRVMIYSTIALVVLMGFTAWSEIDRSPSFLSRLASPRNFYGRLATWQTAARIAFNNPVAGVGLTNYSESFDVIFSDWQHQDVDWIGDIRAVESPHSNFLWIASELGFSGLAPYLLANAYLLFMGFGAWRRAETRQQFLAGGGFLALFAAYTIPGFTLQSGFYSDLNLYFFFMLGLLSNIFTRPHR